jgi:DNA segregation ATPase FtsK/SpoIIIE, S-DNA-T family
MGSTPSIWHIEVEHGPEAGRRWTLRPNESLAIGRREINDRTVSGSHLVIGETWAPTAHGQLAPSVRNLSSTNPATIDGIPIDGITNDGFPAKAPVRIRVGASMVRLVEEDATTFDAARHRSTTPITVVHRPPVVDRRQPVPTLTMPAVATVRPARKLSVVALVLPVLMGAMMAVLINPLMALMAATTPVLMLGNWAEDKRRAKRDRANGHRSTSEQLATFEQSLKDNTTRLTNELLACHPSLGELDDIATTSGLRLWERRLDHHHVGVVSVGLGSVAAAHQVERPMSNEAHVQGEELLSRHGSLFDVPVTLSLAPGRIVGLVGNHRSTSQLARSLIVQAAVLHGPVDLRIAVLGNESSAHEWLWAAQLPHTRLSCDPLLAATAPAVRSVVDDLGHHPAWTVVVIDDNSHGLEPALLEHPSIRAWLTDHPKWLTIVVLADRIDRIPHRAETVVFTESLAAELQVFASAAGSQQPTPRQSGIIPTGISVTEARRIASALARHRDGAAIDDSSALPSSIELGKLLLGADATAHMWHNHLRSTWGTATTTLTATLGVAGTEPVAIDLVADGPHALIAGTTGSGKSEFLRTLICSMVASHGPNEVNFVLIDYKGGAAFTGLNKLPHTVGFVTDLDAGLGQRALMCLEAELQHRERVLQKGGVDDIKKYRPACTQENLPRLVVIIDEFATMIKELPDFVSALIGIAQRGRSLGVHLVLATQRPAGAVNDTIRANTNLRLSLRVQAAADSSDVLGTPKAAALDRRFPGRAVLRLGPDEFVSLQTASCTISADHGFAAQQSISPGFREFDGVPTWPSPARHEGSAPDHHKLTDLNAILNAACALAIEQSIPAGRRPWPDPLPDSLAFALPTPTAAMTTSIAVGLVDCPSGQRIDQLHAVDLTTNVMLVGTGGVGVNGSGTTQALVTIATALAASHTADELHLYLVDHGPAAFEPLTSLPHVGARITASEPERLDRLSKVLTTILETRRTSADGLAQPAIVVCIDDWGSFRSANDDPLGATLDRWYRIFADGPALGVICIVTMDRAQAMPSAAASSFGRRFAFRLNDPMDDSMLGISRSAPARSVPGRALDLADLSEVQFAFVTEPTSLIAQIRATALPITRNVPQPIDMLPLTTSSLTIYSQTLAIASASTRTTQGAALGSDELPIPIGIGDTNLTPIGWNLMSGEHLLITGPSGSGKTTALVNVGYAASKTRPALRVAVLCGRRQTTSDMLNQLGILHELVTDAATMVNSFEVGADQLLVLCDDVELIDDAGSALSRFITARHPHLWIAATGRADTLRSSYGHWSVPLRRSRKGLALRPHLELDGDLWSTALPRRGVRGGTKAMPPGRGYLLDDGSIELVQVGHFSSIESGPQAAQSEKIAS